MRTFCPYGGEGVMVTKQHGPALTCLLSMTSLLALPLLSLVALLSKLQYCHYMQRRQVGEAVNTVFDSKQPFSDTTRTLRGL